MYTLREWLERHRTVFRRVAHMLKTVTLVLVVAMGGAVGGYALAQWEAQEVVIQLPKARLT